METLREKQGQYVVSYRIGVLTGNWSTNIGNAFFQEGAKYVLQKCRPNWDVRAVADVAGYIFPKKAAPANGYEPVLNQQLDYVAVLGPFIRPEFSVVLLPTLKKLAKLGVRFIGLGVGMMDYTPEGSADCIAKLADLPFDFITTRDEPTFNALSGLGIPVFDGIDLGFFLADFTPPTELRDADYMVMNFDVTPEPIFVESSPQPDTVEINGRHFAMKFRKWRTLKSFGSVAYSLFDRIFLPQSQITELAGWRVIRTDHRLNPIIERKVYCSPNTFSHDIWEPYASIYSGSKLTLTNRVHAAVATLAYGNPARLFVKSRRKTLLDRVGAGDILAKTVSVDQTLLSRQKAALCEFIDANLPRDVSAASLPRDEELIRRIRIH